MRIIIAATCICFAVSAAQAQDMPYRDDRSTAESVVASFYNAINRAEYSRAYGYFGDNAPSSYAKFTAGYAKTKSVTVLTGKAVSDGAAGSTYYALPVAIDAIDSAGKHTLFAGCYTLRLVQPQVQEPPFRPLHIEKATLKPAKGGLKDALPQSCN